MMVTLVPSAGHYDDSRELEVEGGTIVYEEVTLYYPRPNRWACMSIVPHGSHLVSHSYVSAPRLHLHNLISRTADWGNSPFLGTWSNSQSSVYTEGANQMEFI